MKRYDNAISIYEQTILSKLVSQIKIKRAIEIGCCSGESTKSIIQSMNSGARLICIDWFLGNSENKLSDLKKSSDTIRDFRENINSTGRKDDCIIIISKSDIPHILIENNSIDFIFIDADHRYDGFMTDLKLYWPKLKIGGTMSGHDMDTTLTPETSEHIRANKNTDCTELGHCGVILGVHDFFHEKIAPIRERIWAVKKISEDPKKAQLVIL